MANWWNLKRFDVIETAAAVIAVAFIVGVAVWRLQPPTQLVSAAPPLEGGALVQKYGPTHNSEHEEEWIIRDFFHDRREGVFVDVGANDYRLASNTYYLEVALGWSGLAIEPQRQFEDGYRTHRPRSRFLPFFISDVSNQEASLYFVKNNRLITSSDKSFAAQYGDPIELKAPTSTLDDLLTHEQITHFDFLSMDIELAEPKALKGFDLERFRPALVCIEAHPEVRQAILNYFAERHYVVVGQYLRMDTANLYFAPADALVDAGRQ